MELKPQELIMLLATVQVTLTLILSSILRIRDKHIITIITTVYPSVGRHCLSAATYYRVCPFCIYMHI